MKSVYINVYNKKIIDIILKNIQRFKIYSQGSSYRYLIENQIDAIEIQKTDIHPNLNIILSLFRNEKNIPSLIIADTNEDDYLNKILIFAATIKKLPIVTDEKMALKLNQTLEIFGDITEDLKKELIYKNLMMLSYRLSKKSYEIFPYIFEDEITIPLKKIKDFKYGENPHQKASYYHSTLKTSINLNDTDILNGELSFNHIIDISKIIRILRDLKQNSIIIMRHSNIVFASINYDFKQIIPYIDDKMLNSSIVAISGTINNFDIINFLEEKRAEMLISTSFDDKIKDNLKKQSFRIKLLKIKLSTIDTPKEYEIINTGENFLIQDSDTFIEEKLFSLSKNSYIPSDQQTNFALTILKNIKTFSSLCIVGNMLIAVSQSEPSPFESLQSLITKIKVKMNNKNMIKLKGSMIVAFEGNLDEMILDLIGNLHLDRLIITDKDAIKNYAEKLKKTSFDVLLTYKRHFRHF